MHTYELTAKGKKVVLDELRGQPSLIFPELKKPVTAAEIAERVSKQLDTKQKPLLVVRHYLAVWQRAGLVRTRGAK